MIRVLIADDQELIRQSLGIVLGAEEDLEVTGMAKNGREVISMVQKNRPDVILMDIRMPEMDGVQCTRVLKEYDPTLRIVVLTTFDDDRYVFNALKYGACGYLLKGVSMEELVAEAGGTVAGRMAVLAEGDAQDRSDITYLEKLPVFNADGTVKE